MKRIATLTLISGLMTACAWFNPQPAPTSSPTATLSPTSNPPTATWTQAPPTATTTPTATASPTANYPEQGYGPENFPQDINPLTGLKVLDPNLLDRRPVAIKVNIVPRTSTRPPWGLSAADIVYDYYQNDGYTRFHAIFLGQNTELAGPIRSARFPDHFLIRMYKSFFAYGSADPIINSKLFGAEYSDRLVLESGASSLCPPTSEKPLCRFDPQGYDFLLGSTEAIHAHAEANGIDDGRQNLDGMYFNLDPPIEGELGEILTVRYSGDSYTRWEYDQMSGKYVRYQDAVYDQGAGEEYALLTDRNNEEPIAAENVVVVLMEHTYYRKPPAEIVEILISGSGPAYAFRDGKVYEVRWNVPAQDSVLYLTTVDGKDFPFKPGKTWIQVIGQSSLITTPEEGNWRYEFLIP